MGRFVVRIKWNTILSACVKYANTGSSGVVADGTLRRVFVSTATTAAAILLVIDIVRRAKA